MAGSTSRQAGERPRSERRRSSAAKKKKELHAMYERRVLYTAFAVGVLGSVLLLISTSTSYWVTVTFSVSEWRSGREYGREYAGEFYKTGHYHGLWRICRQEYVNNTAGEEPHNRLYCRKMYLFRQPVNVTWGDHDAKILLYRSSAASLSIVGLVVSLIAHGFTWYSLNQLRYMYKRLAGILQLIAGACCLVTVEVFKESMVYENKHLKNIIPDNSKIDYGVSYALSWISFIFFFLVGIIVLACSRKRKGGRAHSVKEAQENEPVNLGRI